MEALEITYLDGGAGLRLAGDLDLHTAPRLSEAFAEIVNNDGVKLDVSELTFIDSSGLHAIVACARSANGSGPLILEGASPNMLRMFEITELTGHSNIEIRGADGG
jgi:anti-anti-sigma factor